MSGTPLASLGICRFANLQYRLAFKFEREFSLSFLNSVVQRTAHSKVRLGAALEPDLSSPGNAGVFVALLGVRLCCACNARVPF